MCLPLKKTVRKHHVPIQLQNKWCGRSTSIVNVAQCFFAFPIKASVFFRLFGQIVKGEPCLLCDGCNAAASTTPSCNTEFRTGFRPQIRLQQRSKPCDQQKLVEQSAVHQAPSAWTQSGSGSVGHVEAGECFSPNSDGKRPPPKRRCKSVLVYAHSCDQHRGEQERNSAFKRELLPDLPCICWHFKDVVQGIGSLNFDWR